MVFQVYHLNAKEVIGRVILFLLSCLFLQLICYNQSSIMQVEMVLCSILWGLPLVVTFLFFWAFDFPIVQYVDDILIVMPAEVDQLQHLQSILGEFSSSTGLKVNFSKSSLLPINVNDERQHCWLRQ